MQKTFVKPISSDEYLSGRVQRDIWYGTSHLSTGDQLFSSDVDKKYQMI